jgi:hypothetical protein
MKILEAQSATLTNFEVYNHLMEQGERYKKIDKDAVDAAEKRKQKEDIKARQKGEIPSKERPVTAQNLLKRPGNLWTLRKEVCPKNMTLRLNPDISAASRLLP